MADNPMMPGADTMAAPVGPWNAMLGQYLAPAPNTQYGSVLPVARDMQTGALRFALPSSLRDLGQGVIDLLDGPATGTVTPQATMALASLPVAGGVAAGADAAGDTLASGPIVAYHGSPHDFDAFDASKIGTGEGAQAYGHGLYFAGDEAVARGYRDKLAPLGTMNAKGDIGPAGMAARLLDAGLTPEQAIDELQSRLQLPHLQDTSDPDVAALHAKVNAAIGLLGKPNGHMYQVAINADPASLLDWDKPLSEQPTQVQNLATVMGLPQNTSGSDVYDALRHEGRFAHPAYQEGLLPPAGWRPNPAHAAEALKQAGIPGIQYLDAGSRAAGDGTRNYVVFDPAIIEMLRKYGLAGLTAGGGAGAVAATQPGQQPGT